MTRLTSLMILSLFCLLSSFTVKAQMSDMDMSMSMGGNANENTANMMMSDSDDDDEMTEQTMSASSSSSTPTFPTALLTTYAVDIHFLAVNTSVQYIAYHFCNALSADYIQCAVYNGTDNNSRLVATELIISESVFQTLDQDEKDLWHSHGFAISNGLFVIPGLPADQEEAVLESIINTYGKVTDFWHSYLDFPSGGAKLAYGITAANQINATVADQLDKALNLPTTWQQRQATRQNWTMASVVEGQNEWLTSGVYPQYVVQNFNVNGTSM